MAAPSPSVSNNSSDTATTTTGSAVTANVAVSSNHLTSRTGTPPKTLRGLNKPKCRVCGNVARSRCPYESCKSCCARNQNPCHIHVLKANATFPDKTPTSSSPLFDKQSADPSPSGNSFRVASLRQLSSNFSQFNNVQIPLRSRKPLTRKDAAAINEWRFEKLREFRERHIEAENEAFDRYMQNVNLLEEVFSMKSLIDGSIDDQPSLNSSSTEANPGEEMISALKLSLVSNPSRLDNSRKRIRQIVDDGLKRLQKVELTDKVDEATDLSELEEVTHQVKDGHKRAKGWQAKRALALSDLVDKLNKARNEEDLKSCLAMKHQLFNEDLASSQTESEDIDMSKEPVIKKDLEPRKESGYSLPKLISKTNIDQETLNRIDTHFSSLKQIGSL